MRQEDYIMREIEKIGLIMSAIRDKVLGRNGNYAIAIEKQMEETKGMLLHNINFDLDQYLALDMEDANEYLSRFKGFNAANMEVLAEIISQIGFDDKSGNAKKYLEKALQLYELCNLKDNAYSLEREANISAIKSALVSGSE